MSMELDNVFSVPTSPAHAWEVLLDVERIAPCMPGATVEEFDGEVVTGLIKVKVGPVSLTYRGTAKFIERDPDAQVVVLEASGKETRGAGTASATVRASLEPEAAGDSTRVVIHTTMNVTGRPAQFGRGVIAEVGGKLLEKFADNLAQLISDSNGPSADSAGAAAGAVVSDGGTQDAEAGRNASPAAVAPGVGASPAAGAAAAPVAPKGDGSLNLVRLVGPAILKRVVPIAVAVAALALLGRRFRHLLRRGARKG
jgi:carbon monoxide dehydrogenase subunit G